jgi:hypothetical protein
MGEIHPAATAHLPPFITGPGETDVLFVVVAVLLVVIVLTIGNLYLRLHALPEQVAHRTNKVQMEIVAILALIALFTHNHLYWIAALLLAFVQFPDFSTPIASMARSLERLAHGDGGRRAEEPKAEPEAMAQPADQPADKSAQGNDGEEEPKEEPDTELPAEDRQEARG